MTNIKKSRLEKSFLLTALSAIMLASGTVFPTKAMADDFNTGSTRLRRGSAPSSASTFSSSSSTTRAPLQGVADMSVFTEKQDTTLNAGVKTEQPAAKDSGLIKGNALTAFSTTPAVKLNTGTQQSVKLQPTTLTGGANSLMAFNKEDATALHNTDIAILIDTSSSMKEKLFPENLSRWDWCRNQLLGFTERTTASNVRGIDILLFNSDLRVFPAVDFNAVTNIFASNYPGGGTKIDPALSAVFSEHFKRKAAGSNKKLKVIIITDCLPPVGFQQIALAASQVSSPKEISITFLSVVSGGPFKATFSATQYPNIQQEVRPFETFNQNGLSQTILQIIKANP